MPLRLLIGKCVLSLIRDTKTKQGKNKDLSDKIFKYVEDAVIANDKRNKTNKERSELWETARKDSSQG